MIKQPARLLDKCYAMDNKLYGRDPEEIGVHVQSGAVLWHGAYSKKKKPRRGFMQEKLFGRHSPV